MQHGRPIRALRAEPVPGDLCDGASLLDAVAAQDRAQVGQVALHGAAIGQPARGGGPLGRCRPAFGPGRPAEQGEDQRLRARPRPGTA